MKCRKVLATLLAIMLMVSGLAINVFAEGELEECPAGFSYADGSWVWQAWNSADSDVKVNGSGTYTVSVDGLALQESTGVGSGDGAMVLCVDVEGLVSAAEKAGKEIVLTDVKLIADGTELAIDKTKVLAGDLEEKGNFRIEFYNEYGATKSDPGYDYSTLSWTTSLEAEFTIDVVDASSEFPIAIQYASADWAYQVWQDAETATVVATGAGTYKVSLTTQDFVTVNEDGTTTEAPESVPGLLVFCVDLLGMNAALAKQGKEVAVTDIKIIADGVDAGFDASKVVCGDLEDNGNARIEIYNEYGATKDDPGIDKDAFTWTETLDIEFTIDVVDIVYEYPIAFAYSDPTWAFGIWQDATNASGTLTGNGTFSVKVSAADVEGENPGGVNVFCLDILGLAYDVADFDAITISDVKVIADGEDIGYDSSKVVYGWLESATPNYRIEIYNEYGATKDDPGLDAAALTWSDTLEVQFTIEGLSIEVGKNGSLLFEPIYEFDPAGEYHAYIGFQTDLYTFRNEWTEVNYGKGTEYFDKISGWDTDNNWIEVPGTITDAVVAGNGTYRVSLSNIDWQRDDSSLNLLFISTDIPYGYDEIVISNVKVIFDGNEIYTFDEAFIDTDASEADGYIRIMAVSTYNSEVPVFGYTLNTSVSDIALEFTISGFNYDKTAENEEPTEAATTAPTEAPTEAEKADNETQATEAATPSTEAPALEEDGGNTPWGIIAAVAAVVVAAAGGAGFALSKKKKVSEGSK